MAGDVGNNRCGSSGTNGPHRDPKDGSPTFPAIIEMLLVAALFAVLIFSACIYAYFAGRAGRLLSPPESVGPAKERSTLSLTFPRTSSLPIAAEIFPARFGQSNADRMIYAAAYARSVAEPRVLTCTEARGSLFILAIHAVISFLVLHVAHAGFSFLYSPARGACAAFFFRLGSSIGRARCRMTPRLWVRIPPWSMIETGVCGAHKASGLMAASDPAAYRRR